MTLYKELFTVDDLRMRGVRLSPERGTHAIPRTAFKISKITKVESSEDCIWYDLACTISPSWDGDIEDTVVPDDHGFINIRTAAPAPGSIVEESMLYRSSLVGIKYIYLDVLDLNEDEMTISCAKMSMADQKVYEDKFHLLAPFTSLYTAACLGDGRATISSSTGMRNNLRIFR